MSKVESRRNGFTAGLMLGMLINTLVWACIGVYSACFATKTPAEARIEKLVEAAHAVLECDFTDVK